LADHLTRIFNVGRAPAIKLAADARTNAILVSASDDEIAKIKDLIARLDTPSARDDAARPKVQVQVRVIWLVNDAPRPVAPPPQAGTVPPGVPAAPAPAPPPDDLKEVLPALTKFGIDKPRLAAQTLVSVTPDVQFQAKGVASLDGLPCQFAVTGRLVDKMEKMPVLEVTLRATRERATRDQQRTSEEIGNLQTEITAPPGHFVVLGMTPMDAMTSIFVVQVLVPDGQKPGAQE
jgi:hypothetical protein